MSKRNVVILLIAVGLIALVAFSYAIIAPEVDTEDLIINSTVSTPLVFTAEGASNIVSNVSFSSMAEDVTGNVVSTTNDTVVVTLDTDGKESICCDYDVIWEWAETDTKKNQYYRSDATLEEYIVKGSLKDYYYVNEIKTILYTDPTEYKGHVPDYGSDSNVLFSSQICNEVDSVIYPKIYQDFAITTEFYNLNVNQDALQGASLNGALSVNNINCYVSVDS